MGGEHNMSIVVDEAALTEEPITENQEVEDDLKSSCEQAQDIISDCIKGRVYLESCNDSSEDVLGILSAKGCEEVLKILKGV